MEIRIAKFGGHNVRHVFISRRYVNFGRTYEHVDGIKKNHRACYVSRISILQY